jgi:hypothetical protein
MFNFTRKSFFHNLRSLFYAFSVTSGIYVALQELHQNKNITGFIIFSIALFMIYIAEIISNWYNKSSRVELNMDLNDKTNEFLHIFHKIILPILLYISLIGFGFYNFKDSSFIILLIAVFLIFFILFVNIRAFFEHKLSAEHKTHYIYDIIIFLIFFTTINFISNTTRNQPELTLVYSITAGALSFMLISMMLLRSKGIKPIYLSYNLGASLFIFIIFFLLHFDRVVNALQVALGLLFVFYLSAALIHHRLMKTLTRDVFIEYLIVILLVLTITYGIS